MYEGSLWFCRTAIVRLNLLVPVVPVQLLGKASTILTRALTFCQDGRCAPEADSWWICMTRAEFSWSNKPSPSVHPLSLFLFSLDAPTRSQKYPIAATTARLVVIRLRNHPAPR